MIPYVHHYVHLPSWRTDNQGHASGLARFPWTVMKNDHASSKLTALLGPGHDQRHLGSQDPDQGASV